MQLTGFASLDEKFGGFKKGELILLLGPPNVGKTTLALQWANNIAKSKDLSVIYYEFGQSLDTMVDRLLTIEENEGVKLKNPESEDRSYLKHAIMNMSGRQIFLNDPKNSSCPEVIYDECLNIKNKYGLGLIVIDDLGYWKSYEGSSMKDRHMGLISHSLKMTAMKLEVPIIAISYVEKGEYEFQRIIKNGEYHDIDIMISIYRCVGENVATISIDKNKDGDLGSCELIWDKDSCIFRDLICVK